MEAIYERHGMSEKDWAAENGIRAEINVGKVVAENRFGRLEDASTSSRLEAREATAALRLDLVRETAVSRLDASRETAASRLDVAKEIAASRLEVAKETATLRLDGFKETAGIRELIHSQKMTDLRADVARLEGFASREPRDFTSRDPRDFASRDARGLHERDHRAHVVQPLGPVTVSNTTGAAIAVGASATLPPNGPVVGVSLD